MGSRISKMSSLSFFLKLGSIFFLTLSCIFLATVYWGNFLPPEPFVTARVIFSTCENIQNERAHEKCTARAFAEEGSRWGMSYVGEVLTSYQSLDSGYRGYESCHVLAHEISNDLAAREPGGWKKLIAQMDAGQLDPTRCGGGFMHGALEVRAGEDPEFTVDADLFQELCHDTLPQSMSDSCAHILGHLALIEVYGELPQALELCEGLEGRFLFECYGGIFMEDSFRTNLQAHGLSDLPTRDIAWFETQRLRCEQYTANPVMASGCWYDLVEVFAQTHQYDLEQTYTFCASAPNDTARTRCYERGSYVIALVPEQLYKSSYSDKLCSIFDSKTENAIDCMHKVVGALLTNSLGFLDRTIQFCGTKPDAVRRQCFSFIQSYVVSQRDAAEVGRVSCESLLNPVRSECMSIFSL